MHLDDSCYLISVEKQSKLCKKTTNMSVGLTIYPQFGIISTYNHKKLHLVREVMTNRYGEIRQEIGGDIAKKKFEYIRRREIWNLFQHAWINILKHTL